LECCVLCSLNHCSSSGRREGGGAAPPSHTNKLTSITPPAVPLSTAGSRPSALPATSSRAAGSRPASLPAAWSPPCMSLSSQASVQSGGRST